MKRALKSENRKLVNLKRYLKTCGVRINNYNKLFEGCKTEKAKERKLQNMLVELGVEGNFSSHFTGAYSESYETSKMERFRKIINGLKP